MSTWRLSNLGELVELQRGHDLPSTARNAGNVPVLGSFGVTGWHNDARYEGPGVAIGRSGASIGTASFVTGPFWPLNTCLFVKDFRGNDPRWVFHLLDSIDFTAYNSGSAQPSLNRNFLRNIPVSVPSGAEQVAIAEVLGALDDKIAANHKMADLADTYLRLEYLSASDVTVRLGDVLAQVRDGVSPDDLQPGTAYVGLEHVPRRSLWLSDWASSETATSGKSRFEVSDVLFGKLRPYFHKVVSAPVPGVCSTDILVLRAKGEVLPGIAMLAASSDHVVAEATASSSGTRMPRANWKVLCDVNVPWPRDAESARRLNDLVETTRSFVYSLLSENRTLGKTRDILLPQLVSGELRVRDAERIASDTV